MITKLTTNHHHWTDRLAVVLFIMIMLAFPVNAFTVLVNQHHKRATTTVSAMPVPPSPVILVQPSTTTMIATTTTTSPMNWMTHPDLHTQTSTLVAIQEYKTPTKEELAQKKRNFNLIFWGGGFVAPFLATVFYFGFKFWEK